MVKKSKGSEKPWTMGRLMDLATAYWRSATLSAAVELDLFSALAGRGLTAAAAARRLGASRQRVEDLLRALAALGLARKRGPRFVPAPGTSRLLDRSSPENILDALKFNLDLYALWGRLASTVRTGVPALPPAAHLGRSAEQTRRFALAMHARAQALAPSIFPALDLRGCRSLLDLASGPGTFGCLLAEKHPALKVTLFDLPPILEVARELAGRTAAADRIGFHPGDYRADPLPGPFDAVLYCGAAHQETPAGLRRLFSKIRGALRPGGRLWIVDMMLAPGGTAPLFSTLFSLNMALMSARGRVHEGAELARMLVRSGLVSPACIPLPPGPYWVVTAVKPAAPARGGRPGSGGIGIRPPGRGDRPV